MVQLDAEHIALLVVVYLLGVLTAVSFSAARSRWGGGHGSADRTSVKIDVHQSAFAQALQQASASQDGARANIVPRLRRGGGALA